jgi:hypothetical protein
MKWAGFEEENLVGYIKGNQWSPTFAGKDPSGA